jgi:transposase-like protein
MVVKIGGRRMFLWRAVDDEGEVLDVLVQKRRNRSDDASGKQKKFKSQGSAQRFLSTHAAIYIQPPAPPVPGCVALISRIH